MPIIPEDMYGDVEMEEEVSEETMESPTALLPKSIVMGKDIEVGDSIILRVTSIYDNELEVEYGREKPKGPPMEMEDMEGM